MFIHRRLQFPQRFEPWTGIAIAHAGSAVPCPPVSRVTVPAKRFLWLYKDFALNSDVPSPLPPVVTLQLDPAKTTKGRRMKAKLTAGAKAPNFKILRDGGGEVSLSDYKGRKLVLYFFPKADTSGCTVEAKDFSKLASTFARADTAILGVSADPVARQERFKIKHDLKIVLGSDESHDMLTAYGVWAKKSMYGRSYMGVLRNTYLIGPDGKIAQIWEKVKIPGHADEVLAAAKAL
jgi:peroxiredoxin Q/BCP